VPGDSAEERMLKRLQVAMTTVSIPFVAVWGLGIMAVGRPDAGVQPFGYCLASVVLLAYLGLTRRYDLFRWLHTLFVMLGPFALHLYLGGFAASGGAILWSLIAPVAAMMFVGRRQSLLWVACITAMLVAGAVRELVAPAANPLPPWAASVFFAFNTAGMLFFLYFSMSHFTGRIQAEQERADRLLLNILPKPIAEQLKRRPHVIAQRFESVTVVFGDLVGFTGLSQQMDAASLVKLLDAMFSRFDALADQFGLEKIKTIGDAYMVVAGVPEACSDHAARAARMALAMRSTMVDFARERAIDVKMRIGLHTGEVVAGVIGQRKFSYDLWGDTVNTASRMESHGEPGRIQLSAATRDALPQTFSCAPRGTVQVKGKGEMQTFWLEA
jgi:guanylate cyclase